MLRVCDAIVIHCNTKHCHGGKRSHIGAVFQIWIKSSPPTCKSTTDLVGRHGKGCAKRARKDFIRRVVRAIGQGQNEPRRSLDCGACYSKNLFVGFSCFPHNYRNTYKHTYGHQIKDYLHDIVQQWHFINHSSCGIINITSP